MPYKVISAGPDGRIVHRFYALRSAARCFAKLAQHAVRDGGRVELFDGREFVGAVEAPIRSNIGISGFDELAAIAANILAA